MHLFEIEGGWFGLPLAGENAILWIDIRPYKTLLEYLPGTSSGKPKSTHLAAIEEDRGFHVQEDRGCQSDTLQILVWQRYS